MLDSYFFYSYLPVNKSKKHIDQNITANDYDIKSEPVGSNKKMKYAEMIEKFQSGLFYIQWTILI